MTHPTEPTDEYALPRVYQRRHTGVLHQFKSITVYGAAILTTGALIGGFLRLDGDARGFAHLVYASDSARVLTAQALVQISQNLASMSASIHALAVHDSVQDAALADDRAQIIGLNRRKADK